MPLNGSPTSSTVWIVPPDKLFTEHDTGPIDVPPKSNTTRDEFRAMVRKAKMTSSQVTFFIGTVKVTDQFFVERYSHVMHIVSNVEGRLAGNRDALDALAAGFPAGTVSGAPKVRAMQIIDELEKEKRGLYAGCVGYFSAAGSMDTCIVLRTAPL